MTEYVWFYNLGNVNWLSNIVWFFYGPPKDTEHSSMSRDILLCSVPNESNKQTQDRNKLFGCSTAALKQQMALNFELIVSNQLFSVVLASCKCFKISAPGIKMRHM
jgi:hypothetical protein